MRTIKISIFHFAAPAILLIFSSCKKDDEGIAVIQEKKFISVAAEDGYIENRTIPLLPVINDYFSGSHGKVLCIGWSSTGHTMRSFLSFDVSDIFPSNGDKLVIESANLSVFEANTNMHPFDGLGVRVVNCYLIDYGKLDKTDYALDPFANCGTIATWGYNTLKEYPLDVSLPVSDFLKINQGKTKIQFRLQFVPDGNVTPLSPLTSSMWNIFSGNETQKPDYRPSLFIKYRHEKE